MLYELCKDDAHAPKCIYCFSITYAGIILCMRPANERRDWVHIQNDPCTVCDYEFPKVCSRQCPFFWAAVFHCLLNTSNNCSTSITNQPTNQPTNQQKYRHARLDIKQRYNNSLVYKSYLNSSQGHISFNWFTLLSQNVSTLRLMWINTSTKTNEATHWGPSQKNRSSSQYKDPHVKDKTYIVNIKWKWVQWIFYVQNIPHHHHRHRHRHHPSSSWASYQIRKIAGCACAGNAGNVFPATDFKGNRLLATLACITARASRTCRDACRDR